MTNFEPFEAELLSAGLPLLNRITNYSDPHRFLEHRDFKAAMLETMAHGVSDIFIQPGAPIAAKLYGKMRAVTHECLDQSEVEKIVNWAASRETAHTDILRGKPVNERYELFDPVKTDSTGARVRYGYRVSISPILYRGTTSAQIVMRAIPNEPPTYDQVGLSKALVDKCTPRDGIVIIAGVTGSGKTTSFAAIMRYILENVTPVSGNIITHEDPIEYIYERIISNHSIIAQSFIGEHFDDFYAANREAMRRSPGLCLVGEMRDEESIRAAIEMALTGHPVFGTLHATDVAASARRMISRFPESERSTAIYDIIDTTRLIIAQRLVPSLDGKRVAAREWLEFTPEVREQLMDLTDMGRVNSAVKRLVMKCGHPFEAEAERLLNEGLIGKEVARSLGKC